MIIADSEIVKTQDEILNAPPGTFVNGKYFVPVYCDTHGFVDIVEVNCHIEVTGVLETGVCMTCPIYILDHFSATISPTRSLYFRKVLSIAVLLRGVDESGIPYWIICNPSDRTLVTNKYNKTVRPE